VLGLLHLPPTMLLLGYQVPYGMVPSDCSDAPRMATESPKGDTHTDSAKLATTMNHTETINLNDIAMGAYAGSYDVARLLDGQAIEGVENSKRLRTT
jgi:hypothetical protein